MRRSVVRFLAGLLAIAAAAIACRQGQPPSEPRPEPNTPLPKIDRPEEPPPPSPVLMRDAG
jgi:hypothetical protein